MDQNIPADVITLVDDEGIEKEFIVLDFVENEKGRFYALLPNFELPDKNLNKDETYFIFEIVEENGEEQLSEVEDENLLEELAQRFETKFENEDINETLI